jgi:Lysyl oxidase
VRRIVLLAVLALVPPLVWVSFAAGGKPSAGGAGLLPELRTVVPRHLGIQNQQQREYLRFANGIANLGPGDLRLRPDPPPRTVDTLVTTAVQEILDADGNIASEQVAGTFEYHPEHNHWHIGDVAQFEVRVGSAAGPLLVNDRGESVSIKTTFCLIDWYQLEGNSNTKERLYWDCATSFQGIAPGWVDQYHQSLAGQKVDITGAEPGLYYLVSIANPVRRFLETDYTNNTAWTSFRLTRDSSGNAKLEIVGNSPCETPGLCGVGAPNR